MQKTGKRPGVGIIVRELIKQGVGVQVHYVPVHLHPYYRQLGYRQGDFPEAETFSKEVISLPLYPSLTSKDVIKIIGIIDNVVG